MNSFIIVDSSPDIQKEKALKYCLENNVHPLDITIVNMHADEETKDDTKALRGIALIRHVREKIYLKPIKGTKKALVIISSDLLSIPAQNSLLKTLEEPPPSTILILTTENSSLLLPTILSRCHTVGDSEKRIPNATYRSFLLQPENRSISSGLQKAEELGKQKEAVLLFLENEMLTLYDSLQKSSSDKSRVLEISHLLSRCFMSYKLVKTTNINSRFALENLFLTI